MPPTPAAPLSEIRLQRPIPQIMMERLAVVQEPVYAQAEPEKVRTQPTATIQSEDGQRWCSLTAWLTRNGEMSEAKIQCRKNGLSIRLDAGADAQLKMLPFDPDAPLTATVVHKQADGTDARTTLQVILDDGARFLKLNLPFPDTEQGRALYGQIVAAMTKPTSEAVAEVTFSHRCLVRVPAPDPRPIDPIVLQPDGPTRIPRDVIIRDHRTTPVVRDHRTTPVVRDHRTRVVAAFDASEVRMMRPTMPTEVEIRRPYVLRPRDPEPADPATGQPTTKHVSIPLTFNISLAKRIDDTAAFPDLPQHRQNGWAQMPGRPQGKLPLFFRDSTDPDEFFYLPTHFKLGFYREGPGETGRPPIRAESYLKDGEYRVKVTLVALPQIDEADREALRAYLRDTLLQGFIPYVRLTPVAGATADFIADFTAGSAGDQQTLPASIQFNASDAVPDARLVLQFDMEATDYGIFCELLRKGLHGKVALDANGVRPQCDVRLELDNMITNLLDVAFQEAEGSLIAKLAVSNLLDVPVGLSSIRVSLVDRGTVPGMIFGVEEYDLFANQRLEAKAAVAVDLNSQRIVEWDETVVALGTTRVETGTPDEWLARVHRDPSLQPQAFKVRVIVLPAAAGAGVQLARLKLFKEGETTAREERQMIPGGEPWIMNVPLTLAELATGAAARTGFSLEYESMKADGSPSLPQRIAVSPTMRELPLLALVETPTSVYTIEPEGGSAEEVTRTRALEIIATLRSQGKRWRIFARQPEPTGPTDPAGPTDPTTTTQPTGPAVTLVTDLLAERFRTGKLQQALVVLQATQPGAPSTTIAYDAQNTAAQTWRATGGTIPPFKYKITYLYEAGVFRQVEGTETNLVLILDPPTVT